MLPTSSQPLRQLQQQLQQQRQRRLYLIESPIADCMQQLRQIAHYFAYEGSLYLGQHPPDCIAQHDTIKHAKRYLGQQFSLVIYDAYAGFSPDSFAAIFGTIIGGGLMVLLSPALDVWPQFDDPDYQRINVYPGYPFQHKRFLAYWSQQLRHDNTLIRHPISTTLSSPATLSNTASTAQMPYRTTDQQHAVQQLCTWFQQTQHRPCLVTADRGRGKSASLGLAARQFQNGHAMPVIYITAPSPEATATASDWANNTLEGLAARHLQFIAPDRLLLERPTMDVLLVDEAAALPLSLLQQILQHYPRTVFATTLHGYEGSGRGFALQFTRLLQQHDPNWQHIELQQAIRWANHDPLEQLCMRSLLLDAEVETHNIAIDMQQLQCLQVMQQDLLQQPELLRNIFALLLQAHYQTTPDDLRLLFDGPGVRIFVLQQQQHILGAALTIQEGNLPLELAQHIVQGRRRVRGHLMPQSMANHAGFAEFATLTGCRISRIVIHPQYQQRGLGQYFLRQLIKRSQQQQDDYIAASFGATAALLRFWQRGGLQTWRIGHQRDHCSGHHSFMLGCAFNHHAQLQVNAIQTRLQQQLCYPLQHWLSDLSYAVVEQLLREPAIQPNAALDPQDYIDIESFILHHRQFDYCMPALQNWLFQQRMIWTQPSWQNEAQRHLLIAKLIMNHSWTQIQQQFQFKGQKPAIAALKAVLRLLWDEGHATAD